MLILKLLRYIMGYVEFEAHGVLFERFMSMCAQQNIPVFAPKRKDDIMTGYVLARDYIRLRKPAKKSGIKIRIVKKRGTPFFISRYRLRFGIFAGVVLFLSVLTILSNFVWSIEVVGAENVDSEKIVKTLEELGLKVGTYIPSIDVRRLSQQFLLKTDEVSWIGININSSVARIQVHERVFGPEFTLDNDKACDVVAAQAGLIKYMEVYDGQPLVKTGDVVLDGQLLVSGILEDAKGNVTLKHARAKILALVWENAQISVDMVQKYRVDTGKTKTLSSITLFGFKIPLYFSDKADFEHYEETSSIPLSIFGMGLPISVEKRVLVEYETQSEQLTEAAAKKQAFEQLERYIEEHYSGAFIEKQDANGSIENGKYILTVNFTIKKDIASEKEILFEEK